MADTIKFSDEEIQEIQNLQQLYTTVVNQAGQVHIEEITLHERKGQVEANFAEVKKREQEILSNLTSKYGQGSINLETGEFTPVDPE
jgi:hypothetical protein